MSDLNGLLSPIAFLFIVISTSLYFLFTHRRHTVTTHHPTKPSPPSFSLHHHLPPGPKPIPFVGSLLAMYSNKPAFRWILNQAEGKSICCIRLGGVHVIPVNCPEIAREFLKSHDAVFASRPLTMATEYSGRGFRSVVICPLNNQWKKMRRVVASEVLNQRTLRWQHGLRVEEADNLVRCIHNQSRKGVIIDVRLAVRQYCGNVIRRMLFGRRCFGSGGEDGVPGKEEVEHVEAAFGVLSMIYAFCVSDYLPWLRWLDLNGHERTVKKAVGVINKYHDPIMEERVTKWRGGGDGGGDEVFNEEGEPKDLLDVMFMLKDSDEKPLLTVEEIKAQAAELIYATVDNPSNVVEWALAEMMSQPDILSKAVEELDRVVGKDRLVQESDFPQLTFIRACAREALRLHPVAPFNLPHVSTQDAVVAGYFIPKGSHVLLSRVGLGRNPRVWQDPLKFDPERHLGDDGRLAQVELAEPELRFISFSTGRRGCMGQALGTAMTYMLLARLLQCFNWSAPPGPNSSIDLSEEENSLFMAKPLYAMAEARLPSLETLYDG